VYEQLESLKDCYISRSKQAEDKVTILAHQAIHSEENHQKEIQKMFKEQEKLI
jgi:hypothetical protein